MSIFTHHCKSFSTASLTIHKNSTFFFNNRFQNKKPLIPDNDDKAILFTKLL